MHKIYIYLKYFMYRNYCYILQGTRIYTMFRELKWVHTVKLPRTVTPYRDSVTGTRDHVTYQKLVTR
jgi:hypothetical protein